MSWTMNSEERLTNEDLPQQAINELFSTPYPATFWSLIAGKLTLNSQYLDVIPEPINTALLVNPYPASFWYLDDAELLINALLPKPLISYNIYLGDNIINNIYIGDTNVSLVMIGDTNV